jgi:uncharacterized membrane protein YqhA
MSAIAIVFSLAGALLMFVVGAVTTVAAFSAYLGGGRSEAFTTDAALETTVKMVSALDEFLLALVLFIFAYGVYGLFIARDDDQTKTSGIFGIRSLTDLKVKLLETVAILLAVLFLKFALEIGDEDVIPWSALVFPIAVGVFSASIWLIKRAR